jgi:regulator of RNase E activity RraA
MASLPHTVPQEILDKLMIPSTATISSALKSVCGIDNAFMHGVAPCKPGCHMAGPAYTLRYIPARADLDTRTDMPHGGIANSVTQPTEFNLTDPQRVAVEALQPGDVFVVDARGETRCGTMGAILATRMAVRGCVGLVTDGCYRDTPEIAQLGLAAYSGAMNAQTNKTYHHPSEIQVPISCGEVAVVPGDIIVGDEEGVIVVPASAAAKVAELSLEHETHEEYILEKIRGGASIVGTYPPDASTDAEMEKWMATRVEGYEGRKRDGVFKNERGKL